MRPISPPPLPLEWPESASDCSILYRLLLRNNVSSDHQLQFFSIPGANMPVLRTDLIANGSMLPDFSQLHARANGRPCSYQSCCKCHSFMQITARRVVLIIRELCGTSARGEAKLVSSRDLVKYKCLTNSDLRFTYSRGEFQKFYCPVEFPYCIFVRNILLLRFSGPKSENNPLFCFSHFLM